MSVTFAPEFLPTGRFHITTFTDDGDDLIVATTTGYAEACEEFRALGYEPGDAFIVAESAVDGPELNVSNDNARDLLLALGLPFDEDLVGSEPGETFAARVLLALAEDRLDAEVPRFTDGPLISCGRRAGYITDRLQQLLDVATFAREHGLEVTWS